MQNKQSRLIPALMTIGGLALILGAVLFWILNPPQAGTTSAGIPTEATYPEIPRVSLGEAKAAFDLGNAVFLDARDPQSYAQSHIPGAINIPVDELEGRLGELKPSDWIITYCT